MQPGRALRNAVTLEREKEMEFNTIMQALVKDIAEQLRPMVADMVRQELANADGATVLESVAANIDLGRLAEHLSMGDLAGELTSSQLSDIASDIDLGDLAGEFDADTIMQNFDLDDALREFFSNNTFSIRP